MDIDLKTMAIRVKEKEDGTLLVVIASRDPRHSDVIVCEERWRVRVDGSQERIFVTWDFDEDAFKARGHKVEAAA